MTSRNIPRTVPHPVTYAGPVADKPEDSTGDVGKTLALAREALGRGDVDAGVEWLEQAAANGDAEAMHLRANLAYRLRDNENAFV
jgi:TPR repeat protein